MSQLLMRLVYHFLHMRGVVASNRVNRAFPAHTILHSNLPASSAPGGTLGVPGLCNCSAGWSQSTQNLVCFRNKRLSSPSISRGLKQIALGDVYAECCSDVPQAPKISPARGSTTGSCRIRRSSYRLVNNK